MPRGTRLRGAGALDGGRPWRFHHLRPKNQNFHFFLSFKCLNHMLEDKSMSLMHKQQEKLVEIVDFDKFVLTAENVLQ